MNLSFSDLLKPTTLFDYESANIQCFLRQTGYNSADSLATAVEAIHDSVRDTIDYGVFNTPLHVDLKASDVITEGSGFCFHKSILFVACCRKIGVPAVLCSDIVTNHVTDTAMIKLVGGVEFLHWYTQIFLNGQWIRASPVFNSLLCKLYGIDVLRFDPTGDSIEQQNRDQSKMHYKGNEQLYPNPSMKDLLNIIACYHPQMVTNDRRTPTSRSLKTTAFKTIGG